MICHRGAGWNRTVWAVLFEKEEENEITSTIESKGK